jgi:hypothetical protein
LLSAKDPEVAADAIVACEQAAAPAVEVTNPGLAGNPGTHCVLTPSGTASARLSGSVAISVEAGTVEAGTV